jgi:hypothetical protein
MKELQNQADHEPVGYNAGGVRMPIFTKPANDSGRQEI